MVLFKYGDNGPLSLLEGILRVHSIVHMDIDRKYIEKVDLELITFLNFFHLASHGKLSTLPHLNFQMTKLF